MVALSSPLPEIRIPIGSSQEIALVPFAKTVKVYAHENMNSSEGAFQPTCTIVDFFVEEIAEDQSHGTFRVNFEDVEQGADHDMDFIVRYEYKIVGGKLDVKLTHEYQSAGYTMHAGYVISGTTKDGVYLEVASKPGVTDYYLDTPPDRDGPGRGTSTMQIPPTNRRTFTPSNTSAARLLKNPLWYAAKWGGFKDINQNGIPDQENEWDSDGDGNPDSYVYVANPTKLEEQMRKTFEGILSRASSGTPASITSSKSRNSEGAVYLSSIYPEYPDAVAPGVKLHWAGQVQALFVDGRGNLREDSNKNQKLDLKEDKIVHYPLDVNASNATSTGLLFITDSNGDSIISPEELNNAISLGDQRRINFLWTSSPWLNGLTNSQTVTQRIAYADASPNRYIFTFADKNQDMVPATDEIQSSRSEERRVGKECRSRWSPYH